MKSWYSGPPEGPSAHFVAPSPILHNYNYAEDRCAKKIEMITTGLWLLLVAQSKKRQNRTPLQKVEGGLSKVHTYTKQMRS